MANRARVISVEDIVTGSIRRFKVTFDKEWQSTTWHEENLDIWFDDIVCVTMDELGAWQMGVEHINNPLNIWRDKDGDKI